MNAVRGRDVNVEKVVGLKSSTETEQVRLWTRRQVGRHILAKLGGKAGEELGASWETLQRQDTP